MLKKGNIQMTRELRQVEITRKMKNSTERLKDKAEEF